MKTKNLFNKFVAAGMIGATLSSALYSPKAHAITEEEGKRFVLDSNAALIKLATGVDIKTLPLISALFPTKDPIDYERIARDVNRIVKQAFVENTLFDQNAKLSAVVENLALLAKSDRIQDQYMIDRLAELNNILARTSQPDVADAAIGYYASAAQMYLNALGVWQSAYPSDKKIRETMWDAVDRLSHSIYKKAIDLKFREALSMADAGSTACDFHFLTKQWYTHIYEGDQWLFFDSETQCGQARFSYFHQRAHGTDYLFNLVLGWQETEVGMLGGQEGLAIYREMKNPKTRNMMPGAERVLTRFEWNLMPGVFEKGGTICRAVEDAIDGAVYDKVFPSGSGNKAYYLSVVGCWR